MLISLVLISVCVASGERFVQDSTWSLSEADSYFCCVCVARYERSYLQFLRCTALGFDIGQWVTFISCTVGGATDNYFCSNGRQFDPSRIYNSLWFQPLCLRGGTGCATLLEVVTCTRNKQKVLYTLKLSCLVGTGLMHKIHGFEKKKILFWCTFYSSWL